MGRAVDCAEVSLTDLMAYTHLLQHASFYALCLIDDLATGAAHPAHHSPLSTRLALFAVVRWN